MDDLSSHMVNVERFSLGWSGEYEILSFIPFKLYLGAHLGDGLEHHRLQYRPKNITSLVWSVDRKHN